MKKQLLHCLPFFIFSLLACSPKKAPPKEHAKPASEKTVNTEKSKPISESGVLDRDNLLTPEIYTSEEFKKAANSLFSELLENESSEKTTSLYALVTSDCNIKVRDCILLEKLQRFRFFADVMQNIFTKKLKEFSLDNFLLLQAFLNTSQQQSRTEIDILFIEHSEKFIVESRNSKKLASLAQITENMIPEVFNRVIKNSSKKMQIKLLRKINPLRFLFTPHKTKSQRQLLRSSLKELLYVDEKLNPILSSQIQKNEGEKQSYTQKYSIVKNSIPQALRNLDIPQITKLDEYFLIVDSVVNDRLSFNDIELIWSSSNKDQKRLGHIVNNYAKLELLSTIHSLNKELSLFFKKSNSTALDFFNGLRKQSDSLTPRWVQLGNRLAKLQKLRKLSSISKVADSTVSNILQYFKHNTKYLLVYPQQLMLLNYLSTSDFDITIPWYGRSITVNSKTMLRKFIRGKMEIFFDYGTHLTNQSRFHDNTNFYNLSYSFDYALKTGTFETFGITPAEFINEFIRGLISSDKKLLLRGRKDYFTSIKRSPKYDAYQKFCSNIKTVSPQIHSSLKDLRSSPLLGSLNRVFYEGGSYIEEETKRIPGEKAEVKKIKIQGLNINEDQALEVMQGVIKVSLHHLRLVRSFIDSYKQHIEKSSSSSGRFESIEELEESLLPYYKEIYSFLSDAKKMHRNYSTCSFEVITLERKMIDLAFIKEKEYLKKIHSSMKELRDQGRTDFKPRSYSGFIDYDGFDTFDENTFSYHGLDVLARFANYVEDINQNSTIQRGYVIGNEHVPQKSDFQPIEYTEDFELFLQKALYAVDKKRWLKWFGRAGAYMKSNEEKIMWYQKSLQMPVLLSRVDISEFPKSVCGDCKKLYTPEEIVSFNKEMVERIKSTDTEKYIASLLKHESKYKTDSNAAIVDVFVQWRNQEPFAFFDYSYFMLKSEKLGKDFIQPSVLRGRIEELSSCEDNEFSSFCSPTITEAAKMFYEVRSPRNQETLIFPISKNVNEYWERVTKSQLKIYLGNINRLEREIERVKCTQNQLPEESRLVFEYGYSEEAHIRNHYLSYDLFPDKLARKMNTFHKNTNHFFQDVSDELKESNTSSSCTSPE